MPLALVTGATGLVGANLAALLSGRGWQVRVLRRRTSPTEAIEDVPYEATIGDVLNVDSLRQAMIGCDVVFHVAGVSDHWRASKEWMYQVNVEGTRRVMEAALASGVRRVVYTSSVAALGIPSRGKLLSEADNFNGDPRRFPYGHSKYLAEQEVHRAIARGLDAVIVNPAVVLGPRDVHLGSASIILERHRHPLPVVPSGGMNIIDAADVAVGHLAAAEKGRTGERYILGSDNTTHWDLACIIARAIGKAPPRWILPARLTRALAILIDLLRFFSPKKIPINGLTLRLSAETFYVTHVKADRELGLPHTPLEVTVKRTVAWLREKGYLD
jgi:dihydroflavonol-4-reductase